jgi:hypothetical protein
MMTEGQAHSKQVVLNAASTSTAAAARWIGLRKAHYGRHGELPPAVNTHDRHVVDDKSV